MKKFIIICLSVGIISCQNKEQIKTASASNIQLPYTAGYTSDFNNNVSDSDLLVVLNSYKDLETGDLKAFRTTLADTINVEGAEGFRFVGPSDSILKHVQMQRDSLSSIKINMDVWLKNHSLKDSSNFINVWYKEIDTYKNGKVDSANYEDVNMVKNGKIAWHSEYKQLLK